MNIIYLNIPVNEENKSFVSIDVIQKWGNLIKSIIETHFDRQRIQYEMVIISNSLEIDNPLQKYHAPMYNDSMLKIINLQIPIIKDSKILNSFEITPKDSRDLSQLFISRIENQWEYVVVTTPFEVQVSGNNRVLNIPCKEYSEEEIKEIIRVWELIIK